jgi:hypothetical protein
MSIRAGSRPEWLYWPKVGYWQFHISWLRLKFRLVYRHKIRHVNWIEREYRLGHDRTSKIGR